MISALELKNKLERFDKNTPLLDYNVWFGFLPAIILFPFFVILNNAYTESQILNSPFLLWFGFAGIFISSLVLITGGLMITHFSLSRYISIKSEVRRFNANSLLEDDFLAHGISTKIWESLKIHRKHDPLYQADLERIRTEIDNKLKTKADKSEIDEMRAEFVRKIRVKDLVINKLSNEKKQAERDRDEKSKQLDKVSHELRLAIGRIFAQDEIIKIQKKIIKGLNYTIKKLRGE